MPKHLILSHIDTNEKERIRILLKQIAADAIKDGGYLYSFGVNAAVNAVINAVLDGATDA